MTAALTHARRGWHVHPVDHPALPVCAGIGRGHDAASCADRGKHPCTVWGSWATTDEAQIIAEWSGRQLNVGVACGPSGLLVIDEDTPGGFAKLAASLGVELPDTYTVTTGRGRHFYFAAPDAPIGNSAALKDYGCDVRGVGGYVVAAGSTHSNGSEYVAESELPPAPCPDWLLDALTSPEAGENYPGILPQASGLAAVPATIRGPRADGPGERHGVLLRYACSMRTRDVPLDEARVLIEAGWARCEQPPACATPMPAVDARAIVEDVYRRYPAGRSPEYTAPPVSVLDEPIPPSPTGRETVRWGEFWARPISPREWLVPPLVARGEIVRVFAQAKVGKSLLVLEGVLALVSPDLREFLGRTSTTGTVIYVDQENTEDDWRERLAAFGESATSDLSRLHWFSLQSWPPLDTAEGGAALLAAVRRLGADLVVLDTQSKLTQGDEDRSTTHQAFYRHTLMPLKRAGVAAIVIDHAGHQAGRARGSSEKADDMDSVWSLTGRGPKRVTLTNTHSRRPCEVDTLYLYRNPGPPLRHTVDSADDREEQITQRCHDSIAFLDPADCDPRTASTRAVGRALRDAGKKYTETTVREAHRRFRAARRGERDGDDE